ncbi:hypothetical protein [Listeria ilorinensis]|uniref:hypothetical protein n=1 Tax=Listeria ilorinensis TaxID=2867439 RepID=UPI001EF6ACC9|nr:hypothetical protein [Listeria ilorinensis]
MSYRKEADYKTVGVLLADETGTYDRNVAMKLGIYIRDMGFVQGRDYEIIDITAVGDYGYNEVASVRAYKPHTWEQITAAIQQVKVLL